MEDQFKLLMNNFQKFIQTSDFTKARNEYDKLVSYQRKMVKENPNDCAQNARLGMLIPMIVPFESKLSFQAKVSLYNEGLSYYREVQSINNLYLTQEKIVPFFLLMVDRAKTVFAKNSSSIAQQDLDEAIELGCAISEDIGLDCKPIWKLQLAELYILRSRYYSRHTLQTTENVRSASADLDCAIDLLQDLKSASPKDLPKNWQRTLDLCIRERASKPEIKPISVMDML
jgi:hypothetical protein